MPKAPNPPLLLRLVRARRAPRAPDPADMGTAFGLEYILDQAAHETVTADAAVTAAAPSDRFRRWLHRKVSR